MPTTIQNFQQAQENISEAYLLLFEFWEEFSTEKHRAVLNNEDVIFDGEIYIRASVEITLPNEGDDQQLPSLTFSNVDRVLGKIALNTGNKIICRMIEIDGFDYTIINGVRHYNKSISDTENMMVVANADVSTLTVSGELFPKLDLQIPTPISKTNKNSFPGLYL